MSFLPGFSLEVLTSSTALMEGLLGIDEAIQQHDSLVIFNIWDIRFILGMSGVYWHNRTAGAFANSIKSES